MASLRSRHSRRITYRDESVNGATQHSGMRSEPPLPLRSAEEPSSAPLPPKASFTALAPELCISLGTMSLSPPPDRTSECHSVPTTAYYFERMLDDVEVMGMEGPTLDRIGSRSGAGLRFAVERDRPNRHPLAIRAHTREQMEIAKRMVEEQLSAGVHPHGYTLGGGKEGQPSSQLELGTEAEEEDERDEMGIICSDEEFVEEEENFPMATINSNGDLIEPDYLDSGEMASSNDVFAELSELKDEVVELRAELAALKSREAGGNKFESQFPKCANCGVKKCKVLVNCEQFVISSQYCRRCTRQQKKKKSGSR